MREMKDTWKELKRRGDEEETEPLTRPRATAPPANRMKEPSSHKAAAAATDPEESDYWDTGFTLRELGPQAIRLWLGLQIMALFFQLMLWSEVSSHLYEYEEVISMECAAAQLRHGVCTGPMWNLSSWQDVVLSASGSPGHSASYGFQFSTSSSPPTFLLVVDPVSAAKDAEPPPAHELARDDDQEVRNARWGMEVVRVTPPQVGPSMRTFHVGQHAMTFEDLSVEARDTLAARGKVEWRATLTAHGMPKKNVRYVAFVEDAASSYLKDVHSSPQCAFGQSWKAFNEQHQGHSHRALSWCRFLLGIFVLVGAAMVNMVYAKLQKGGPTGYRFHLVVLAKFVCQDLPQQLCIVLYLLGWFEASGLRCQLCLFHPQHCGAENAFNFSNSMAIVCTLLSSVANQLLIRPSFKRIYTEDDLCLMGTLRVGGICVSILPFTTGVCFATKSLLPAASFLHILAAIPCGVGWLSLFGGLLVPCMLCCDESCDDL